MLSQPRRATVALVGDSHSNHYYQSLATRLPNESVVNLAVADCFPFACADFASKQPCIEAMKELDSFIEENESIKAYILSGYFSVLIAGGFKNGNYEGLREAKELRHDQKVSFQRNGEILLTKLLSKNKNVYVILDIADLIVKPISGVSLSPFLMKKARIPKENKIFHNSDNIGISRQEYEERIRTIIRALKELLAKFPQVKVFDPRTVFCDDKHCCIQKRCATLLEQ